jgi:transcriptional regulator with XRE-family HTH domain
MSLFDRYTESEYVDTLRVFLKESRRNFMREAGFTDARTAATGMGRLPKYEEAPLRALEERVNAKSARCEAPDTTFGERLQIARDYTGYSDSQVADALGVSREMVRRWGENMNRSTRIAETAELLSVPEAWLEHGGEENLPANSHLGVRVGGVYYEDEAKKIVKFVGENAAYREQMYAMTQAVIAELPDEVSESYMQAYIEWQVFNRFEMATAARRAGGRWQIVANKLLFAPWHPIEERGLVRRYWSDEVEAIIQEELAEKPSIFGAHKAITERCKALGLTEDEFPKRISLHKRVEKERDRAQRYGVDLNDIIAKAVEEHAAAAEPDNTVHSQETQTVQP